MEQSQAKKIRYTVQYYRPATTNATADRLVRTISQDEPPTEIRLESQKDATQAIIEIVCVADAPSSDSAGSCPHKVDVLDDISIKESHMIVHSQLLSQTIRDVVKFYPDQGLNGSELIIHEPYACLIHSMSELECLMSSDRDSIEVDHLEVLLGFLRPRYTRYCAPAIERSMRPQPTAKFDDIWVIMKPDKCTRFPAKPSEGLREHWLIHYWYLSVEWRSIRIGIRMNTVTIDHFYGEALISSSPIRPADLSDNRDEGRKRQRFIDRGKKLYGILSGEDVYMRHDGECVDPQKSSYSGDIVICGHYEAGVVLTEDIWNFQWLSISDAKMPDMENSFTRSELMEFPEKVTKEVVKDDQCFIFSPYFGALALPIRSWFPITVENVHPIPDISEMMPPVIDERRLRSAEALVDWNGCPGMPKHFPGRNPDNKVVMLFEGPTGVGKSYTIEFLARKFHRPIVPVQLEELRSSSVSWSILGKRWNAIFVAQFSPNTLQYSALDQILEHFSGTLILTGDNSSYPIFMDNSSIELKIVFNPLNDKARDLIWSDLEKRLHAEETIRLHQNASKFLRSSEARRVEWNGHAINRCFKLAIALATVQNKTHGDGVIIVEDAHFKEAMNIEHESRPGLLRPLSPVPFPPNSMDPTGIRARPTGFEDPPNDAGLQPFGGPARNEPQAGGIGTMPASQPPTIEPWFINLSSDSDYCSPRLNRTNWDSFQSASKNLLFRKTMFHAIDILLGEPLIRILPKDQRRGRRQNFREKEIFPSSSTPSNSSQNRPIPTNTEFDEATFPERIRINSPAIIRAFAEITDNFITSPFLVFRPFRSLLYHEQDFRDAIAAGQKALQGDMIIHWSTETTEPSFQSLASEEQAEKRTARDRLTAGLEQMECLVKFINELKTGKDELRNRCPPAIPFADVALLFTLGDTVISKDHKQAYLVVNVICARHRVKTSRETNPSYWKDKGKVEFEDNPVRIYCTHIDFDGKLLGPVLSVFTVSRFSGQKEVTSLPIFPLKYAENGLRDRLIERGKTFFKVAGIRHMHYKGLTLKTRDEVDSQVVIDFDEAINRNPEWKPFFRSLVEETLSEDIESGGPEQKPLTEGLPPSPRYPPHPRGVLRHGGFGTEPNDFQKPYDPYSTQRHDFQKRCVDECCETESTYYDEYVDIWRREDFVSSQLDHAPSGTPPVSIIPRDLRDIEENNTLTDDEYLIMSFRVFGFVLRSRKWHELDMTHVFEVAKLGEGEGFDELVLPSGHGSVVKSMIRQHLRERKASGMNRDRTDVVRGKGRGLIILLHGVPGVGKTSTAECVADLFRRPLFQITSGDLGTTAKDVDDSLEENFSLASRWNSILLIDEADVFLAERTKEDFVRNSLVAVFLRMMEYYAGVLFLTTNRVGVFDEAFTSRIHLSLYYPPLNRSSTLQIFTKNWERIEAQYNKSGRTIDINKSEITEFAIDYFENNKDGRWNGRQIRNAFQSALALAELDAWGTDDSLDDINHDRPVVLGRKRFDTVAESYKGFTSYLKQVYGADFARRARENLWRFDAFGVPKAANNLNTRLKVTDPTAPLAIPPTAGQWPAQAYPGYDPRYAQAYYPPPPPSQHYPEHYSHPGQAPRYSPAPVPGQAQSRDPREGWGPRPGPEGPSQ
ncbi:hypothetical protein NPX13_g1739 [Xylaria arbuscula]|uniref:AAA+ ATPase domain-containing protein n=1 Tax=Xylaria arbuscula TaxID=114810 RepID=A0A9W8NM24_9PEZI|nr:hypothetical protein NPX13_g1739 [Xylaria arbuscula]